MPYVVDDCVWFSENVSKSHILVHSFVWVESRNDNQIEISKGL